ncbi:hypothetical protein [Nodularia sphaerocarpa]|uniref:hypothetical protein n=1 Tax=Nodularia sphaerocarpa TaxID=137816 RepID=UPI001EFA77A0|nr:hypothetical protein [Nodularia sphaerocarpa]MDB9376126.1 hypothetical protein [Nodularia sphaerocarpa CS-585]ULP73416.1 hypothetical protein BDGGKGIB_03069 [Nodularia sphaerocarpa UHCC 0038]
MNTYFKQSLVQVQSEEFIADFKVTVRFIIKVIKLLFLLLTGVFVLAKSFYFKVSRQDVVAEVTVCNNLDNSLTLVEGDRTKLEGIISVDDTLDNSLIEVAVNPPLESKEEITNGEFATDKLTNEEAAVVEFANEEAAVQVSRQSQLKSMKAAELRELCVGYGISYKNKSQAIVSILDKEQSMLDELATVELSDIPTTVELTESVSEQLNDDDIFS